MPFQREVYVATKLVFTLSPDEGESHPLPATRQKFFILRTLELYYRSTPMLLGVRGDKSDMLVGVCFFMMYKLYTTAPCDALDSFYGLMKQVCSVPTLQEFKADFRSAEFSVLMFHKGSLMPTGFIREGQECIFHEPWRFQGLERRPEKYAGPRCMDVLKAVEEQARCFKTLFGIKRVSNAHDSKCFFMASTDSVAQAVRSLHAAMVLRCKIDPTFSHTVWCFCAERYQGRVPQYINKKSLTGARGTQSDITSLDKEMVRELSDALVRDLLAMHDEAQAVRDQAMGCMAQDKQLEAASKLETLDRMQAFAKKMVNALSEIHYGTMRTCRYVTKNVDDMVKEARGYLRLRADEERKRKASAVSAAAQPVVKFVKTTVQRGGLMCTRVSPDPYATPYRGVLHSVSVIRAPVKVLIKTFQQSPDAAPRVVNVDVKPSYLPACEAVAAAFQASGAAADAAYLAAQVSDATAMARAADLSAAAAEAMAAASAVEAAAVAAAEAEAAACMAVLNSEAA